MSTQSDIEIFVDELLKAIKKCIKNVTDNEAHKIRTYIIIQNSMTFNQFLSMKPKDQKNYIGNVTHETVTNTKLRNRAKTRRYRRSILETLINNNNNSDMKLSEPPNNSARKPELIQSNSDITDTADLIIGEAGDEIVPMMSDDDEQKIAHIDINIDGATQCENEMINILDKNVQETDLYISKLDKALIGMFVCFCVKLGIYCVYYQYIKICLKAKKLQ